MFTAITHSNIWVLDQDEALEFYVGKLGLEKNADVDLGNMRWLTINVPGEPDREVLLESPDNEYIDPDSQAAIRSLLSKGRTGLALNLRTDDCRGDYEDLVAKGVEIIEEPTERFYGIDMAVRDPFGNHIRITQPTG
ncbi:VOC family protein [Thermoleophilia bacterium SCSIO 60948]|nr:VOC family protein [Thermoleophilia bacterium SCSIO 60948]